MVIISNGDDGVHIFGPIFVEFEFETFQNLKSCFTVSHLRDKFVCDRIRKSNLRVRESRAIGLILAKCDAVLRGNGQLPSDSH